MGNDDSREYINDNVLNNLLEQKNQLSEQEKHLHEQILQCQIKLNEVVNDIQSRRLILTKEKLIIIHGDLDEITIQYTPFEYHNNEIIPKHNLNREDTDYKTYWTDKLKHCTNFTHSLSKTNSDEYKCRLSFISVCKMLPESTEQQINIFDYYQLAFINDDNKVLFETPETIKHAPKDVKCSTTFKIPKYCAKIIYDRFNSTMVTTEQDSLYNKNPHLLFKHPNRKICEDYIEKYGNLNIKELNLI